MPRPHLPQHLSFQRVKSSSAVQTVSNITSAPNTPPPQSRNASPTRAGTGGGNKSPNDPQRGDHKNMGLALRVQVLKGRGLAAKDKSGTSDPFLVLTVGDAREATSAVYKSLNPEWNQGFEFPVVTADSALLEVICWDKDRFKKDYMGEFDVAMDELFQHGTLTPDPKWFALESRRSGRRKKKDENVTGEILLKFSLSDPTNPTASAQQVLQKFNGIVADTAEDEEYEDDEDELITRMADGGLDDVSEEEDEAKHPSDETDDGTRTPGAPDDARRRRRRTKMKKLKRDSRAKAFEFGGSSDVAGVLFLEINKIIDLPPEKNSTRTSFDMDPFVVTSLGKKTYRTRVINHNLNPVFDERLVFQIQKHEINYSLNFAVVDRDKFSGNDFVGTCNFPLDSAKSLAPEADPETGLYKLPDPYSISEEPERRRRFRLPASRSNSQSNISRNSSANNLAKLSRTNSNNVTAALPPRPKMQHTRSDEDVLEQVRTPPTSTPGHRSTQSESIIQDAEGFTARHDDPDLVSYELPLDLKNKQRWQDKHAPVLYIRAKYLPYRALRQQFWRAMLKQYDADESGKTDKVELGTMLDTLGSTLHNSTIDGFFQRWKDEEGGEEELTMDQAVICLEEQLMKSHELQRANHTSLTQKLHVRDPRIPSAGPVHVTNSSPDESGANTPYLSTADNHFPSNLNPNSTTIPALEISDMSDVPEKGDKIPPSPSRTDSFGSDFETDLNVDSKEEHVVEIQECPICHMPRLDSGRRRVNKGPTDADIITHIATCASGDWRTVNNLVMAGFVTSSQAQRKWYSKIMTKISYGGYRLGANSANILVQDRITGMINEERMSVYVRIGIRLLYKGLKSREMEKKRSMIDPGEMLLSTYAWVSRISTSAAHVVCSVRKLLRSMSFKQGRKYDDPASAAQIAGFINFHQLDMSEVLLPMEGFKTFNEFFYRALKPNARPCSAPDNPHIVVSPADCRSVVFNRMDDAQRIWVKGREFSVERLLGAAYPEDAARYKNGALGIMRLAPQDYHRFHIPVDGTMGEPKLIDGEYYTVNPMAIRSALDVYGENIRVCVPIDSLVHGRVMVICVGAMMVGSTVITRKPGEQVKRAEELGYFKFGGSTLLLLFEPGMVQFDEDLVSNSSEALETLIRVGMSIGHHPSHEPYTPDMKNEQPTMAQKQEAKRRIEGSLAPSTNVDGATIPTVTNTTTFNI